MSVHKSRSMDTLHHILSSFRQFEKKLDKLQDDVSYHGQTLTDLRVMIANFSGGTLYDSRGDNTKVVKGVSKTTAMDSNHVESSAFSKRKSATKPLSPHPKLVQKTYQGQKYIMRHTKDPAQCLKKIPSPKSPPGAKRSPRQRKGEAPRKATSLRSKKSSAKKTNPLAFEYPSQFKNPVF